MLPYLNIAWYNPYFGHSINSRGFRDDTITDVSFQPVMLSGRLGYVGNLGTIMAFDQSSNKWKISSLEDDNRSSHEEAWGGHFLTASFASYLIGNNREHSYHYMCS